MAPLYSLATVTEIQHPQCFWVPGELPGLNELLDAALAHRNRYAALKKSAMERVVLAARVGQMPRVPSGYFTYLFVEPNRRRDPSNVASGGVKIIEDALQRGSLLPNDGWASVAGFASYWILDQERPGVLVVVDEERVLTLESMILLQEQRKKAKNERRVG